MKRILLALCVALLLSVTAFADSSYFTSAPFAVSSTNYPNSVSVSSAPGGVYFFILELTPNNVMAYAISDQPVSFSYTWVDSNGDSHDASTPSSWPHSGSTYYVSLSGSTYPVGGYSVSPSIALYPNGTSWETIANDFVNYQENLPVTPSVYSSLNVPAGNVLYFKVASEQDISLVANMPVLSNLIGSPWSSGVQYGPAADLPTSSTVFPIASQDSVNFIKSNTDTNILGQTKIGLATKHCIVGQYYALYCPFHYADFIALGTGSSHYDSANAGVVGANVSVSGELIDIKIFPLSQRVAQNALGNVDLISGSDDGYSSYYDGTVNDDGSVSWTDQNGNIGTPSVGGQNYVPEEVSTQSIVGQIKEVLNNIVSEIKNLFSFGYEAIQSLVGLFSDFVSVLQQLYSWLPSPVYSALVSAIVVAITVGVFKVFL